MELLRPCDVESQPFYPVMQVTERLAWAHSSSSISKTVPPTVNLGPVDRDRTSHKRDDSSIPARLAQLRMAQPGVGA